MVKAEFRNAVSVPPPASGVETVIFRAPKVTGFCAVFAPMFSVAVIWFAVVDDGVGTVTVMSEGIELLFVSVKVMTDEGLKLVNPLPVMTTGTTVPAANTLRYYSDETNPGFVIAPKSAATTGTAIPIAVVIAPGAGEVEWNPSQHSSISAGQGIGLSGDLTGSFYDSGVLSASSKTNTIKFVAFGNVNGVPTIMKGSAVDTSNN